MKLKQIISFVLTLVITIVGIVLAWPGVLIPAAILAIVVYGVWAEYKMGSLKNAIIEERGSKITKKDRFGHIEAEIDIEQPYRLTTPYVGYLKAIYRIKQDQQVLEFSTKTKNAEHLVKDVFKVKGEYPPIAPWNFGW